MPVRSRLLGGVSLLALFAAMPRPDADSAGRILVRVAMAMGSAPPPAWHPMHRFLREPRS